MSLFETTCVSVAGEGRCQDRLAVLDFPERLVIMVADGAGGSGGGDKAAETVVSEVSTAAFEPRGAESWCQILGQIDYRIGRGESTCVVAELSTRGIQGASVGDSSAWLVHDGELLDLTRDQIRKPLLGSSGAQPVGFSSVFSRGLLILSTDGFSKYVKRELFLKQVNWLDFGVLARKLVEMVRLPSGQLWDDVSIVACRRRPNVGRKRYTFSEGD
jgi:hypothetical protein